MLRLRTSTNYTFAPTSVKYTNYLNSSFNKYEKGDNYVYVQQMHEDMQLYVFSAWHSLSIERLEYMGLLEHRVVDCFVLGSRNRRISVSRLS